MGSLTDLFTKHADLLDEAFDLDATGNLIIRNSKKVSNLDEAFRDYFVGSMRGVLNELVFDPRRKKRRFDDDEFYNQGIETLPISPASPDHAVAPGQAQSGQPAQAAGRPQAAPQTAPQASQSPTGSAQPPTANQQRAPANDNRAAVAPANNNRIAAPRGMAVNQNIPPEGRALLDTIAGSESPGYNVLYGGKRLDNYDWSQGHPSINVPIRSGPNIGKTSSAFGRYQFIKPTWDKQARESGLTDMSPASQDKAAWDLAQTTYQKNTRRDLLSDLQNGKTDLLGPALHGEWTSMPGGIEQTTSPKSVSNRFAQALSRHTQTADAGTTDPTAQPTSTPAAQPTNPAANPATAAAPRASSPNSYMAIGDSLAYGVGGKLGNTNYAKSGSNPQGVMGLVDKAVQNGEVNGKHIILSGGASNAGGNSQMVSDYYPKMIQSLKDGGASQVTVMGVGPYANYNKYGYNNIISQATQDHGVNFTGPLADIAPFRGNSVQQQVHPTDYSPIISHVQKNFGSPPATQTAAATPTSQTPTPTTPTVPPTRTASVTPSPPSTPTTSTASTPAPISPEIEQRVAELRPGAQMGTDVVKTESLRRPMIQMLRPYK